MELVEKIFGQNNFSSNRSLARKVHDEKSKIFKGIRSSEPFEGVKEIIDCIRCSKAVVSGSTRNDVETILEEAFGRGSFDVTITADDIEKGKADPSAFLEALSRMKVEPRDALVVENAPLVRSDFKSIIPEGRILEKTGLLRKVLCK
jgi:beta-phosphoglucomutase-like phosphatase (HAD superfamily)